MTASLQSSFLAWIFKLINFRKIFEKRADKRIPRSKRDFVPKRIERLYEVNRNVIHGRSVATFEQKGHSTNIHIVFLHGGAYIFEAGMHHWRFAEKIVKQSHCRMTLIDYPLAPEHGYLDTFDMLSNAYDALVEQNKGDKFILMGDSAGGGLALAFNQKLMLEKSPLLPGKNILLSPWLDLTMTNPDIRHQKDSDYILTMGLLKKAADMYSKGADQQFYLLSPINGDFSAVPETLIFYGTEELFRADCIKLSKMLEAKNDRIKFREYHKMQHDWAVFPIPESQIVVDEICAFIDQ